MPQLHFGIAGFQAADGLLVVGCEIGINALVEFGVELFELELGFVPLGGGVSWRLLFEFGNEPGIVAQILLLVVEVVAGCNEHQKSGQEQETTGSDRGG